MGKKWKNFIYLTVKEKNWFPKEQIIEKLKSNRYYASYIGVLGEAKSTGERIIRIDYKDVSPSKERSSD